MEWNWLTGNNMTPFSLTESTGDSEEVKSHVHHDHEQDEAAMHEVEGVLFRFNDDEVVDDDDAHSCSYDHSSYINTRYVSNCNIPHDQSQSLIYGDDDGGGDIDDDDHDDDIKNQYKTKEMDSSKQQWRTQKSCVHDPPNQREMDRKFWETCLAS